MKKLAFKETDGD